MDLSRSMLRSGEFDLLVLDEVNVALYFGLIDIGEVLDALRQRGGGVEVVCTGRNAPEELRKEADLITVMVVEKHPYEEGLEARKGIDTDSLLISGALLK